MSILDKLNKEQREAAEHISGPLLILAGAGSGKTSTMTHRIAHMIQEKGISPYSILAVTFTNKAAGEMRERVESLLGGGVPIWIMTFHATCLRILRMEADKLGLLSGDGVNYYDNNFVVYDPTDQKTLIKNILKELDVTEKEYPLAQLLSAIGKAKEEEILPSQYASSENSFRAKVTAQVYAEYERRLRKNNAMDFNDLILNAVKLFEKDEAILQKYQRRFNYVMVDEYQDTNHLQYKLIKYLAQEHRNLCVVGDDDQCIYQWRGADISNILNFEKDFKGTKVVKLERNYRSTSNILAAAHSVIQNNRERKGKKLWTDKEAGKKITYARLTDERHEAYYITQEIIRLKNSENKYSDFAILYRTNAQSRTFEESFSANEIPYRVLGGVRYYERKEIKDAISYMRLVLNPNDEVALRRVINEPKRAIGGGTLEKIIQTANAENRVFFDILEELENYAGMSKKAIEGAAVFARVIKKYIAQSNTLSVSEIFDGLLRDSGYFKALKDQNTIESETRLENLMEFKSVIYSFEEQAKNNPKADLLDEEVARTDLADFLEKITLISDVDNHDAGENAVVLMTMHSAKGLEFDNVFLVGMEDGLFPGWRAMDGESGLEEER
ncbi:MAG: ATP-dependent helicase, partial [Anaerovoracaceae bacterium]